MALPAGIEELPLYADMRAAPELGATVDPFSFGQRVAVYRRLIDVSNRRGVFGHDNALNPLWGLMFQLTWQHRTGRLHVDGASVDTIDPDAAWGYGNYSLNTIPYLGAIGAGLVDDVTVVEPDGPTRFPYVSGDAANRVVPHAFVEPIADWAAYFRLLMGMRAGDDLEPLSFALWAAHKTSLDVVRSTISSVDPAPYSRTEIRFLAGWCGMVDYLWAASWPTDFRFMLENGSDVLPERVLTDTDQRDEFPGLPGDIARNVKNVLGVAATPEWRFRINLWFWKRAMRTRAARDEVVEMLDALFNPSPDNTAERRRLFRYMVGI